MSPSSFAVVLAGAADALTFLALPPGAEANPIAAASPALALAAKALLALAVALWPWRYALTVRTAGVLVWSAGAASNIAVLWRF